MSKRLYPQHKIDKVTLIRRYIELSGKNILVVRFNCATFKEISELRANFEGNYQISMVKITLLKIAMQEEGIDISNTSDLVGNIAVLYVTNDVEDKTLCFYRALNELLKKRDFVDVIFGVLSGCIIDKTLIKKISVYENFSSVQLAMLQQLHSFLYSSAVVLENSKSQIVHLLQRKVEISG